MNNINLDSSLKDRELDEIREMAENELRVLKEFAIAEYIEGRSSLARNENQVAQAYLRGLLMFLGKKGYKIVKG